MNVENIKLAVDRGESVHWSNNRYWVAKDGLGQYLIHCKQGSTIALLTQDGRLNGKEEEFYRSMDRAEAASLVRFVVDDAGCGRRLNEDMHAIVREFGEQFQHGSVLVGWHRGFELIFTAVHSYLDVEVEPLEAARMAQEYLEEIGWFDGEAVPPDYIVE